MELSPGAQKGKAQKRVQEPLYTHNGGKRLQGVCCCDFAYQPRTELLQVLASACWASCSQVEQTVTRWHRLGSLSSPLAVLLFPSRPPSLLVLPLGTPPRTPSLVPKASIYTTAAVRPLGPRGAFPACVEASRIPCIFFSAINFFVSITLHNSTYHNNPCTRRRPACPVSSAAPSLDIPSPSAISALFHLGASFALRSSRAFTHCRLDLDIK